MSINANRFLLITIGLFALVPTARTEDVVAEEEDVGPPHDPMSGDYVLINPHPPTETPLPEPSDKECAELIKHKNDHFVLDAPEYIKSNNYSFETHEVITDDGYILNVFRIPGSPLSPPRPGKVPIFLNHGLAGNAWSWLFLPDNGSLAFKSANEGFDVWIGNARGSQYSSEHVHYKQNQSIYWDFSFHELGYYDVPAVIDYILNVTGQKDTYYVGHSLGTMQYLIAMSDRPEYNAKIRVGFLLATAGYIPNIRSVGLRYVISAHSPIDYLRATNGDRMDPKKFKTMASALTNVTCSVASARCGMCDLLTSQLFGFNPNQNYIMNAQFFNEKYFSTTSTKMFSHLHQSMITGQFRKYNYLDLVNYAKYKSKYPPSYPLDLITAPTVNYWGHNDGVTVPEDVKTTFSKFTPGVLKENNRIPINSFNHLDFLIAKDIEKYVYDRILWIMMTETYLDKNKFSQPQP